MKLGRLRPVVAVTILAMLASHACNRGTEGEPAGRAPASSSFARRGLPALASQLSDFPDGPGQATARASCLQCHSADLPRQQRLTEKQWTAVIDKMVRWGTVLSDDQRTELIAYLARHFGIDNTGFTPIATLPAQSP